MSLPTSLRIGTRASPMARAMADDMRNRIAAVAPSVALDVLPFVAEGDRITGSLQNEGGKGTFIKDLERRLLANEIDCAVHSLKDIPGDLPPRDDLTLIAFLPREDPRDALVLRNGVTEDDLRQGRAPIGSSAPRRGAALRHLYPNAEITLCRGNVNSRLRKLDDGAFGAIVLSYAGLCRLGFADRANRIYNPDAMLPAVGQGIVTLQIRAADRDRYAFLSALNDPDSALAASIERAMLFRLQGNCHTAIAGYCSFPTATTVEMRSVVYDPATGAAMESVRQTARTDAEAKFGAQVAEDLLAQGFRP